MYLPFTLNRQWSKMADGCVLCALTVLTVLFTGISLVHGGRVPNFEDTIMCRGSNRLLCSGNGDCDGGVCTCVKGFSGRTCEVSDSPGLPTTETSVETTIAEKIIACVEGTEGACSGNGICQMGTCVCDHSYHGVLCEMMSSKGFCDVHKECAECAAFGNVCPPKCNSLANYNVVREFHTDENSNIFHTCRFRNAEHNCNFIFRKGNVETNGRITINVRPCGGVTVPVTTPAPGPDDDDKDAKAGDKSKASGDKPDSGAGSFALNGVLFVSIILASVFWF